MMFPLTRMRRLRRSAGLRDLFQEVRLSPGMMVQPVFCDATIDRPRPITSMPGIEAYPIPEIAGQGALCQDLGLGAIILFGIPAYKDSVGSDAYSDDGVVQKAIRSLKESSRIPVIADLCLCEFTDHGHCGVWDEAGVSNDKTLEFYQKTACSLAEAGADMLAPSGMMDGSVQSIRRSLDDSGFQDVSIMSYSAKFASPLYGPFRQAAGSAPATGDRSGYQIRPGNGREGLRELLIDEQEGADIVMVKPALPYLDVISEFRRRSDLPLAAYQVSGEYSMIMNASQQGLLDGHYVMQECLQSIRRAGADAIISYYAKEFARRLQEGLL